VSTIVVAQFEGKREVNQVVCQSADQARKVINEGNATAASGWRWGLSKTTFVRDDGSEMDVEEANAIRSVCGCEEY
jgi:hypothetical protein